MDCGPSCLRMVAKHYGKHYSLDTLRKKCEYTRIGVSMLGISQAAESIGFRSTGVRVSFEELCSANFPTIVEMGSATFFISQIFYLKKRWLTPFSM